MIRQHLLLGDDPRPALQLPAGAANLWPLGAAAQPTFMMIFYGVGGMAIFATFAAMHALAYRQRDELEFDELERLLVRSSIRNNVFMAGVPALSTLLAWVGVHPRLCGVTYVLLWPLMMGNGIYTDKQAKKLAKAMSDGA